MLQIPDIECPLGLICSQMTIEHRCPNYSVCLHASGVIDSSDDEDSESEDSLHDRNPYLCLTYYRKTEYSEEMDYRSGSFWLVNSGVNLPAGYSPAVDAQIAAHYANGVLTVTADRTVESGTY